MANNPFQNNPAFEKLGDDAKASVKQAFDAMATWRSQVTDMTEKNSDAMFDKMTDAAKALGWPTEFVELSRQQVQNAGKMQSQMIDQVMSTWQQQMTNPGQAMHMPNIPGFPQMPGMPGMGAGNAAFGGSAMPDFSANPMMPLQIWMQAAEAWQKSWQQAMSSWTEAQSKAMGGNNSGRK